MKFFSDFVSCFGSINARPPTDEITLTSPSPSSGSRTTTRNNRRKRGRGSGSVADWKPSLGSISETNAVAERIRADTDQREQRKVKRKSVTGVGGSLSPANKVQSCGRSYSDDSGRGSISAVIPVFAPTPFMF